MWEQDNYLTTAERMYDDGRSLYDNKRWFNSCYLSGYVVECYAKLVLSGLLGQDEVRRFSHDLTDMNKSIHDKFSALVDRGNMPSNLLVDLKSTCPTVCLGQQKWHPNKRYHGGNQLWGKETAVKYREEISNLYRLIAQMKISGVIR